MKVIDQAVTLVRMKLGRCPRCWRLSFQGAAIGWLAAILLYMLWPDSPAWRFFLAWPLAFTALWLLHIAVFVGRVAVAQRREGIEGSERVMSRRELLKAAQFAVVVSVPGLLAACGGGGGGGVAGPVDPCPGALTCRSFSVPQTFNGGFCCVSEAGAGAFVGYLCAFGSNRNPAGCFSSLERARFFCPNAVGIVRCVRGG